MADWKSKYDTLLEQFDTLQEQFNALQIAYDEQSDELEELGASTSGNVRSFLF